MRLLYLHTAPIDTQAANIIQVLHMCRAFSELGHDVTLALPKPRATGRTVEELARAKLGQPCGFDIITYRRLTLGGRMAEPGGYPAVVRILKRHRADLCLVRSPACLSASLGRGVPTVFEAHTVSYHRNPLLDLLRTRNLVRNSKRRHLALFVAISENLARAWIAKGVPADRVLALHDGVDPEGFSVEEDVEPLRARLGLPSRRKIVVYSGSLYADRGIDRMLALAGTFSDVTFVAVGGPGDRVELYRRQARSEGLDNVVFVGHVPHCRVKDYLAAADVLLMTWSRQVRTIDYCSPMKVFEYMAAGRVIVGDGFPTIREVLTDGEDAFLVDPDSFPDLVEAMGKALSLGYPNQMADRARRLVLEKYTWKERARRILERIGDGGARPEGGAVQDQNLEC